MSSSGKVTTGYFRGQVEATETTEIDGALTLVMTVRELVTPIGHDVPPLLFDFVHRLDSAIRARTSAPIHFDRYRTTPSWKLGENEVRAMLVGHPGEEAYRVRILPFSGQTFLDHLQPVTDYFPLVELEDDPACADTVDRIVRFLELGPLKATTKVGNPFERWAEAVFILLQAELGGDEAQTGLTRRCGEADFMFAMDYKPAGDRGIAQLVIQMRSGALKGRRKTLRYDWRTAGALQVAYDAVRAYEQLLQDVIPASSSSQAISK